MDRKYLQKYYEMKEIFDNLIIEGHGGFENIVDVGFNADQNEIQKVIDFLQELKPMLPKNLYGE